MKHPSLTLPDYQAPTQQGKQPDDNTSITRFNPGASPGQINRTAKSPAEVQITTAGEGKSLRLIYGRASVGAVIATVVKHTSGDLLLLCVWAGHVCQNIEALFIGDKPWSNSWGQRRDYLGTQTTPDSWLVEAIAGYADVLNTICYSVLRIKDNGENTPKLSAIRAIVRGQPIATGYENPAQCMAHFARHYMGLSVERIGLYETAARCDEIVSGERRRTLSLVIENRVSSKDQLAVLAEYAGCYYTIADNTLYMVSKKPRSVTLAINGDSIIANSLTLSRTPLAQTANRIQVAYTVPSQDARAWRGERVTETLPHTAATDIRASNINMHGFTSASMASRYAIERLNQQNLCDLLIDFLCLSKVAKKLFIGTVIAVTSDKIGLDKKTFVVTSLNKTEVNTWRVKGREYDVAMFSNVVVTEPSTPDTNLPDADEVNRLSNLDANEVLKKNNTGIWHSYLDISFTAALEHVAFDIEVIDLTVDATKAVWQLSNSRLDTCLTSALVEDHQYRIRARGINSFGYASEWVSIDKALDGWRTPPTDVAELIAVERGDTVYCNWTIATDIDLRDYILKYAPVGEAWDGQFAKTINAIKALKDDVPNIPPGRWDFMVKARDWAGNLSINEARCTVEVDEGVSGEQHDSYDWHSLDTSNMTAIYNGYFEALNPTRYLSDGGQSIASLLTKPLMTYSQPLGLLGDDVTATATTSAHDFGRSISGNWQGFIEVIDLAGSHRAVLQLSQSGSSMSEYPLSAKATARFGKIYVRSEGKMLIKAPIWRVRALAKEYTESGSGISLSNGYARVYLNRKYSKLVDITVKVAGRNLVAGYEDVRLSMTGDNYFDVFVQDQNNQLVVKEFTYIFTGR